ncbi:Short-chain dehydrogenase/reductase SDR [Frankia sp. AiPs1]|uniref:SDR family NAD(P)-dependent oxidoreductase n=1 Tax=Frankia sp. AiPa1 TaxID=573492 RepID=UPI002551DAB8|nr:SDR family NAD(P)-dependent oxidoreductase [Frankia sp. AiPa1]MCL9762733.1 SDR family NAD(P)-dependent oxidoreductase [Frankia sp. AiPa1]
MPHPEPDSKTVVVSGGTDGMGRAVVLGRLARGDRVIAIGSTPAKGSALAAEAAQVAPADRFAFVQADLSSLAAVRDVVSRLSAYPAIDALVLCANRQNQRRIVTAEGLEASFALYYLSRYLLGNGLSDQLNAAVNPVIINVSAPGTKVGTVNFDDLQSERKYSPIRVQAACCRANDLLGAAYGEHPTSKAHYVMYHPGFTATTGGIEQMKQPVKSVVRVLAKLFAKPVDKAVAPVIGWIDAPPAATLTANDRGKTLDTSILKTFDSANAERLSSETRRIVESVLGPGEW